MELLGHKLLGHQQVFDDFPPIDIAQNIGTSPFRVGHHAKNIAVGITNAGDITDSAIGVSACVYSTIFIAIIKYHLPVGFQLMQYFFIRIIPALTMSYRYLINFAGVIGQVNIFTNKLLVGIS